MSPRLALALALAIPAALPAQEFVRVSAGVTGSTAFVKDYIAAPITTKQTIAPTGALMVGHRFGNGYRLAVEGRYARGTWQVDDNGTTDDLGGLAVLSLAIVADGPIGGGGLRWEAAAGQLRYLPSEKIGLFSDGGGAHWMLGGGVSYTSALSPALDLVVGGRYDFHGFSSVTLESDDYSRHQAVHRIALTIGIERGF